MTNTELLEKVKTGLAVDGDATDSVILGYMLAAKQYMINAGVAAEAVETELGIAVLTVGTNDLWSLKSGDVKFSPVFNVLLNQLAR